MTNCGFHTTSQNGYKFPRKAHEYCKSREFRLSAISALLPVIPNFDIYLAFFGHGWNAGDGKGGALFVGDGSGPDTNLSNRPGATNTGVSKIPPGKFVKSGAQVRLFACRSGYGSGSIAAHLAAHLQVPVYGYDNPNGSIFTNDPDVGHGTREYSKSAKKTVSPGNKLWLVPNDGSPKFKKFS